MDYPYPIHIDAINMEFSILYFKGLPINISIKWCILANSALPYEILPYEVFHQGLYCLQKYLLSVYMYPEGKGLKN